MSRRKGSFFFLISEYRRVVDPSVYISNISSIFQIKLSVYFHSVNLLTLCLFVVVVVLFFSIRFRLGVCGVDDFDCGRGYCVNASAKCDGFNDCLNFAEEIECGMAFF